MACLKHLRNRNIRSRRKRKTDRVSNVEPTQFKKEERATDGAKAMAEYKAGREAELAKTERLRALRLAKEAAGKKK